MELYCNTANQMTRWLVSSGALKAPFVLVDIGVQGGVSARWNALGDHLVVYGFDLLTEAIAPLVQANNPRKHYFAMGLADRDDELEIAIPTNRTETRLYRDGPGERRRVEVRRLDTLFKEGKVQAADFIKIDCEGYEPVILRGATEYLAASNLVGADLESNFNLSSIIPNTHFCECSDPLVRQRLTVFDLHFNRVPVADLEPPVGTYRPATLNVLFARNLPQERESPSNFVYRSPEARVDPQTVLKSAVVFESYGLLDWAILVLKAFSSDIGSAVDVDKAISELKVGGDKIGYLDAEANASLELLDAKGQLRAIERSLSWRITAPLRAARRLLHKP
jgi:FkbM family methyltransferase